MTTEIKTRKSIIRGRIASTEEFVDSLNDIGDSQKKLLQTNWIDFIKLMEKLANKHSQKYKMLNVATIVCGVLTPVSINLLPEGWAIPVGTMLGVIVSICVALNQSNKYYIKEQHYRSFSEELKIEGEKYLSLIEKYNEYSNHDEAFKLFMENIEVIREKQISAYMTSIARDNKKQEENMTPLAVNH